MKTWYLLYYGTSVDGRGEPDYIGRTLDVDVAMDHYEKCESSPYCTGKVVIITDTKEEMASWETNWSKYD